ncbi:MAG: Spy/CpxP family protein refolding chaperone [candidate division Zixibacteria bacterium]|nr:Spy/CpxP family protein refolding chaperone [candidate division Zixibacteria bacterium]
MKKILTLMGVMLILVTPIIMADDDAPEAQTIKEVRIVQMDDDAGPMMGMKCGDMGSGKGMGRGMMRGHGDDDMGPGMGMCCNLLDCKGLDLTKEQIQKIKDIMFAHKNAMIDLKAALEKAQLRMGQVMKSDSPDKAKALAAAREVNAAKGQMAEARITHMFNMRGVLTAEQLEKVKACMGGMCGGGPMGAAKCGGMAGGKGCGGAKAGLGCGMRK